MNSLIAMQREDQVVSHRLPFWAIWSHTIYIFMCLCLCASFESTVVCAIVFFFFSFLFPLMNLQYSLPQIFVTNNRATSP